MKTSLNGGVKDNWVWAEESKTCWAPRWAQTLD